MLQSAHREEMSLAAIKLNRPNIEIQQNFFHLCCIAKVLDLYVLFYNKYNFKYMSSPVALIVSPTRLVILDIIVHFPFMIKPLIVNLKVDIFLFRWCFNFLELFLNSSLH